VRESKTKLKQSSGKPYRLSWHNKYKRWLQTEIVTNRVGHIFCQAVRYTTPCLKKLCKLIFCQNFINFQPSVNSVGTKVAKRTGFSQVYSFSTSHYLCQRTTVLNTDVPNYYITL